MLKAPSLNELIGLTDRTSLVDLERQFPGQEELFSTARELGLPGSTDDALERKVEPEPTPTPLPALVALATTGARSLRVRLDLLLSHVLAKMRLSNRIKTGGALAATAAGLVSAALSLAKETEPVSVMASAAFSFVGGIVTILSDQVIRAPSGIPLASPEEHGKIVALRLSVERACLRLDRAEVMPLKRSDLEVLIPELDEQALQTLRYEKT